MSILHVTPNPAHAALIDSVTTAITAQAFADGRLVTVVTAPTVNGATTFRVDPGTGIAAIADRNVNEPNAFTVTPDAPDAADLLVGHLTEALGLNEPRL